METIYQEAIAFKAWVDGADGRTDLPERQQAELFSTRYPDPTASEILRSAKITMTLVAPGFQELRVGVDKMPPPVDQRRLPTRTATGHGITYHRLTSPRIALPRASVNIAPQAGQHGGRYPCGSSVSVATEPATGTLGCLVRIDGVLHGLSCNHVSGLCHHTIPGMPIIGPGNLDVRPGNLDPVVVGHHVTCAPWNSGRESNTRVAGNADLAIFRIKDENAVSSHQGQWFDTPIAVASTRHVMSARDVKVWKVGRTTGLTNGRLFGHLWGGVEIRFQEKQFRSIVHFDDLLVVRSWDQNFATEGDSGSLVVWKRDGQIEAVGILFCTSPSDDAAFLMPMEAVLGHFGATLVGGHNVQASGPGGGHPPHGAVRP